MNKVVKFMVIGLIIILVVGIVVGAYAWGNKQLFDFNYTFDRAIIGLPDGGVVDGKVDSWTDFEDGDQIQVTIDGVTYLTHISNVCLISE